MGRMETARAGWLYPYPLHKGEVAVLAYVVLVRWLSAPLRGEVEVTQRLYFAHLSS